ncbi:hypothetical protein QUF63_12480 [Anaerolineales bacterium HSG25]|nr:hypothetical protein [Anaerolineales bacterium HSG25]
MTAEITTLVGQLKIMNGTWQSNALNQVAVREPKATDSLGRGKGDLFVLTDVLGSAEDYHHLEQRLAEIVRDVYYLARGSVTASLRRAIQAACDHLYQHNAQIEVDDRVVGGIVALAVCQENVFVVQVGPTAIYTISGDYVKRYPTNSIWLDDRTTSEKDELALGITSFIEPNIYHVEVNPQDVLVLADSDLVNELSPQDVAEAVTLQNIRTAIKNLGQAANNKDCSALALTVVEDTNSSGFGGLNMPTSTHLHRLLPTREESDTDANGIPTAFPISATATGPSPLDRLTPMVDWVKQAFSPAPTIYTPQAYSTAETSQESFAPASSLDVSTPPSMDTATPPDMPTSSPLKETASAPYITTSVMASATPHPSFEPQLQETPSGLQSAMQGLTGLFLMMVAGFAEGLKSLLGAVSPDENEDTPRQAGLQAAETSSSPLVSWKMLLGVAIAIPIVIMAIVAISYLRTERLREAEYTTLVTTAQEKVSQSAIVDSGSAMMLMAEAENMLAQAEQIKLGQPEVATLRQQIAAETDTIGKVQRLYHLPHLRSYTDAGTSLKSILVQGVELYVADTGTNRVFHHQIDSMGDGLLSDDSSVLLMQQGQVVDDITINGLTDMVWMPSGGNRQTSDLLVLSGSGLLEYNPNWGVTTSALAGIEKLSQAVAAESFFGNFYLLDRQANTILRYLPTADGYGALPESYFPADQPIDLSQAVDFSIDGAVYVLFQDGRVSKFRSGRPDEFALTGLDKPLKAPVSIFTAPDEEVQHIYIADAGNQRIVQLNKDGSFVRQFKPAVGEAVSFANLQDIFVDEISQRIYILDSNNLYMGDMPALAE